MTTNEKMQKVVFGLALVMTVIGTAGCHRSEDDFDDRTLAQRPNVETVKPEDKKDIFRPGL